MIDRLGLEKGDRVGVYSPNNAEWLLLQMATARAGLILVNVNPGFRRDELAFCMKKVGIKTLVMPESHKGSNYVDIFEQAVTGWNGSKII